MKTAIDTDNRDLSEISAMQEDRIEALKRRIRELEQEREMRWTAFHPEVETMR